MPQINLKWVLLVDDDPTTNMLNRLFIKKATPDVKVDMVANGHRAIDFIDANIDKIQPGTFLIILDIEMPVMNGWDFLEAFEILFKKEDRKKIAVSVLTSNPTEELRNRALKNTHVKVYIDKPLSDVSFKKIIQAHFSE